MDTIVRHLAIMRNIKLICDLIIIVKASASQNLDLLIIEKEGLSVYNIFFE